MDFIKRHVFSGILILALGLGFFLHFRNLDGVIYLSEDEARAFTLMSSGPLIYAMGRPVYLAFGHSQSAVFGMAGLLGLFSIALFYQSLRILFDRRIAVLAAFFYAIAPFRISYARTLLPPIFMEFYFMLGFYFLCRGLFHRRARFLILSGFFSSCILFVHTSGYAMIAGFGAALAGYGFIYQEESRVRGALVRLGFFLLGFAAGFLFLEIFFMWIGHGYEYVRQTLSFNDYTRTYAKLERTARLFLPGVWDRIRLSPSSILYALGVLAAIIFTIQTAFAKKQKNLIFVLALFGAGIGLFGLMVLAGVHTVYERHFVWLASFFSLSLAVLACAGFARLKRSGRIAFSVFLIIFGCLIFSESYAVTGETFKITTVREWILAHQISKKQILTTWWQLNFRGDHEATSDLPGGFMTQGRVENRAYWYLDSPKFVIRWEAVFNAYRMGLCRYVVTSGMGPRASAGQDEALLKQAKPLAVWPHPYSVFKRRPYYDKNSPNLQIAIYDLAAVFSRQNLDRLSRAAQDKSTGL